MNRNLYVPVWEEYTLTFEATAEYCRIVKKFLQKCFCVVKYIYEHESVFDWKGAVMK